MSDLDTTRRVSVLQLGAPRQQDLIGHSVKSKFDALNKLTVALQPSLSQRVP